MPRTNPPDLKRMLELWADSSLKVQVIVFFHNNPGMIETVDGLAKRLGTSMEALKKEIDGHVALGVLRETKAGGSTLLMYDRNREAEVQQFIESEVKRLAGEVA